MPFGITRDLMGDYGPVLTGLAIIPFVLGIACLAFGKPPVHPPDDI